MRVTAPQPCFSSNNSATPTLQQPRQRSERGALSATLDSADVALRVNVGTDWGATRMIGQVATQGRLEVTALGDGMNEAARIESVAKNGSVLASKVLMECLDATDAGQLHDDSLARFLERQSDPRRGA
jgi:class 3 adenylate cyclase